MKELSQKLFLFLLILVLINLPFAYPFVDELTFRKTDLAKRNVNTIFIGSSRTKYAIIPAYFDLLTSKDMTTYNFGIDAGLPPDTFEWCEELMQEEASLRYIFFELSGDDSHLIDLKPWWRFSLGEYSRVVKSLSFKDSQRFHNLLVTSFFKPRISPSNNDYNIPLNIALEGRDLADKKAVSAQNVRLARERNLRIERDDSAESLPLNEAYWNRISRLIEIADARGIRIYFFIPPRLKTESEFETIYPIYRRLDSKYIIGAAHTDGSLYEDDTSTDDFHLNHNGAMKFTKSMAEAFVRHEF